MEFKDKKARVQINNVRKDITSLSQQQAEIQSQVQGIEDDYIIAVQYENILGDISLGPNASWSVWKNAITGQVLVGNELQGTPTETWSELGVRFEPIEAYRGRRLLFTCRVKTDVPTNEMVKPDVWQYNGSANVTTGGTQVSVVSTGYTRISQSITINADATRVDFGIMAEASPYYKMYIKDIMIIDITDDLTFAPDSIEGGYWTQYPPARKVRIYFEQSPWKNKNALVIGDSLTAAGIWQQQLNKILGLNVTTHAKGGAGLIQFVDGNGSDFAALSQADVAGKHLIVIYGGYNDRGTAEGVIGDVYPTNNTIAGRIQYIINTINTLLTSAGNTDCVIAFVTPHCAGKYSYILYDGYQEYPPASGRTMKTLADKITEIANHNSLPCYNAWKNSGINKFNWDVYSASPTAMTGETVNDQLHLNNTKGYPWIGTKIAKFVAGI